jgi:hypothetical protein
MKAGLMPPMKAGLRVPLCRPLLTALREKRGIVRNYDFIYHLQIYHLPFPCGGRERSEARQRREEVKRSLCALSLLNQIKTLCLCVQTLFLFLRMEMVNGKSVNGK